MPVASFSMKEKTEGRMRGRPMQISLSGIAARRRAGREEKGDKNKETACQLSLCGENARLYRGAVRFGALQGAASR